MCGSSTTEKLKMWLREKVLADWSLVAGTEKGSDVDVYVNADTHQGATDSLLISHLQFHSQEGMAVPAMSNLQLLAKGQKV